MEKTGKVNFINSEIKKLEQLKNEIQNECRHKHTKIKFIDGGNIPKVVCEECDKDLCYPDTKRLETFLSGK